MCTGGGKAPKVEKAPVAPSIVTPIEADTTAATAGDLERRRALAASGRSDTILTSGLGDTSRARVGGKKLLGE